MTSTVNNGSQLPVKFGSIETMAGVQTYRGKTTVAFLGRLRDLRRAGTGEVGGHAVRVVSAAESEHTAGMVVLTVEAV